MSTSLSSVSKINTDVTDVLEEFTCHTAAVSPITMHDDAHESLSLAPNINTDDADFSDNMPQSVSISVTAMRQRDTCSNVPTEQEALVNTFISDVSDDTSQDIIPKSSKYGKNQRRKVMRRVVASAEAQTTDHKFGKN